MTSPREENAQDLEADQLVDVIGRERRLVELHAELLHPDCGDADQWPSSSTVYIVSASESQAFQGMDEPVA